MTDGLKGLPEDPGNLPGVHLDFTEHGFVHAVFEGNRLPLSREFVLSSDGDALTIASGAYLILIDMWRAEMNRYSKKVGPSELPPVDQTERMAQIAAKIGRKVVRLKDLVDVWAVLCG